MPAAVNANLIRKLDEIESQSAALAARLLEPEVLADHRQVRSLSIKKAAIEPLAADYRAWRDAQKQIEELQLLIAQGDDAELVALAREELPAARRRAGQLIASIQKRLLTADDQSVGSIILEVRAGVGGDEAGIWAGDLVDMYRRFAASKSWTVEDIQFAPAEHGGFKQAILSISGEGVWSQLGYEGGTHQVKRVPATEAQGRVHTSTATVAVLPQPEEVQVKLDPDDVKENITTSQGPGGQNVNKVATAVHLIHVPTGIEVRMQETRSLGQNRDRAWQLLRARLYERQKAEVDAQRAEARSAMIGSGGRAEKIRTYRWKENIVVDHRLRDGDLGQTGSSGEHEGGDGAFNLGDVMAGRLQLLIDQLAELDIARRLAAI